MKTLRICEQGHHYYKSSDCPTCPKCEEARRPDKGFLASFAAPARRALESQGIVSLKQLSQMRESEISSLHGMGPKALSMLKQLMDEHHISFLK